MTAALSFVHKFEPASDPIRSPILLLHGTGGDESDLSPLGRAIAPGAALLSPRGKVIENGMPRFFRRLREGVFDEDDLGGGRTNWPISSLRRVMPTGTCRLLCAKCGRSWESSDEVNRPTAVSANLLRTSRSPR